MRYKKRKNWIINALSIPFYLVGFMFVLAFSLFAGLLAFLLGLITIPFTQHNVVSGEDYEHFTANYLRRHGFWGVKVTQLSGDYGVDVTAHKGGHKYAVQCKYYTGSVGVEAVQQAIAGKAMYNCDRAMVVTNSTFTQAAENLAAANAVILRARVAPSAVRLKHKKSNNTERTPVTNPIAPTEQDDLHTSARPDDRQLYLGATELLRGKHRLDDIQAATLAKALVVGVKENKLSASLTQRRLQINYEYATRLLDELERMGCISGFDGTKPRTLFVTEQQLVEAYMNAKKPSC